MSVTVLTPESLGIKRNSFQIIPEPLPGLPEVQPFDLDLLPLALRTYAVDVTERMQCPVDFVGVGLMAALSAVVGRRRSIYAKQYDNWSVVPNLWCAIVGKPASMKSPAIASVMHALKKIDRKLAIEYEEALKNAEIDYSILEILKNDANLKAKKACISGDITVAKSLLSEVNKDKLNGPKQVRLIETDTTLEALQISMAASPNGICLYRDELSGWLRKLEQDDHAEARAFYLLSASGRESFSQRRVGRGILFIESCVLTIIGGIQPSHIEKVTKSAVSGSSDDGLIQRFQLTVWPDDNSSYRFIDKAPDAEAECLYMSLFEMLHSLDYQSSPLRMTGDAAKLFEDWLTKLNLEIRSDEMHPALQSHLLKSIETVLAIALLCELADNPYAKNVGKNSLICAFAWAKYLRSHANRLYHHGSDAAVVAAKILLKKRKQLLDGFTSRDVCRKQWGGISSEIVTPALKVLTDYGYLIEHEVFTGGRPKVWYEWAVK